MCGSRGVGRGEGGGVSTTGCLCLHLDTGTPSWPGRGHRPHCWSPYKPLYITTVHSVNCCSSPISLSWLLVLLHCALCAVLLCVILDTVTTFGNVSGDSHDLVRSSEERWTEWWWLYNVDIPVLWYSGPIICLTAGNRLEIPYCYCSVPAAATHHRQNHSGYPLAFLNFDINISLKCAPVKHQKVQKHYQ